ncbi:MAG: metallopeptidase family protein [Phycisphaerales bacterium]
MIGLTPSRRAAFDALLEAVLETLPPALHELLEEAPLIVDDVPSPEMLAELGMEDVPEELCGLHSGVPITERSVEDVGWPETIHLFRVGIIEHAGGPEALEADLREEIRITLLHEIGHHFGLDEDDLERLGYD